MQQPSRTSTRTGAWRVAVLTYPLWGFFAGFGLWSLARGGSAGAEGLVLLFALLAVLTPLPIWTSNTLGLGAKVLGSVAVWIYAFVAFVVMRFAIACEVFGFSCAMG